MYRAMIILFIGSTLAQRNPFEYANKIQKSYPTKRSNKQHLKKSREQSNVNSPMMGFTEQGQLYTLSFETY